MNLSRIVYSFGSPCNGQYGHLVLRDDGTIEGYTHPNEHSWAREADELRLHAVDGSVTSRFRSCGTSGVWIGHVENKKWPLHLIPVVRLAPPAPPTGADEPRTAFFVNSIPKSGTYYVEAALRSAGVASQRLHLSGRDTVHDNRDLTDAEIHVAPSNVLINCEVELVTAMLQGEQVVGHVEHQWIIDRMRAQGVCVLSVVRDLRNVITSLFRFKKAKVAPTDALDQFWRTLSGPGQVIGFLMQYAERDLAHIRTIAEMMHADQHGILLRYEDICAGKLSPEAAERLDAAEPGIAERLTAAFTQQYNQSNPTFSGNRSDWHSIWNPDLDRFFTESGLSEINQALGYV